MALAVWPSLGASQSLSIHAREQIQTLQRDKANWTPAQRKIASRLLHEARVQRGDRTLAGLPRPRGVTAADAAGRLLVDLDADVSADLTNVLARLGGLVVSRVPQFHAIRARVPLAALESLAARADVRAIRPAAKAETRAGAWTSEGDVAHQAALARSTFGVDGTGIRIGVLSDSVDNLAVPQASGDLGAVTVLPGQSGLGAGNTGEGTAILEIVHDLAPGAELYFATAFGSEAEFARNIGDLQKAGCSIIIDDVGYFDEPVFQDGIVAQAVNAVTAAGALYFSAAGNSGNKDAGTSGTWEGDFVDGGDAATVNTNIEGRLHDFGGGSTFNTVLTGGSDRRVDLFWSDPWGASGNDYDLFIVDSAGSNVVDYSGGPQDGSQDPYEAVDVIYPGERVVVVKYSGANRFLHLETGRGRLAISTAGNTRGHTCARTAFGVAAASAANASGAFTAGQTVERFSSDGPRRMFYQPNGTPITPGNVSATGGEVLQKPDVAAADGVSTSLAAFRPFYGTSAAAPHAGALAALLWSIRPDLTPAQMRAALTDGALDIMSVGGDRDSGAGLLMAMPILQPLAYALCQSAEIEADGNGNGIPDPGETIQEWLTWTNYSRVDAAAVSGALSGGGPGLSVMAGTAVYPRLAARGAAVNQTPFTYRIAKNTPPGTLAVFTNVMIADGRATTTSFTRVIGTARYNPPPLASNLNLSVAQGASIAVTLVGWDIDADPLTSRVTVPPKHGMLSGTAPDLIYTAPANYAGPDSFSYVVNDGAIDSASATGQVTVLARVTNTLTVVSIFGGETPGTCAAGRYSLAAQAITNSPITGVDTQYVCTGGRVTGNDADFADATHVTLLVTNDATLTWNWVPWYRLDLETNGRGTVTSPFDVWFPDGSNVALAASAAPHNILSGWYGDTNGCVMTGNVLQVPMTGARHIGAVFGPDSHTLAVASAHGGAAPGGATAIHGASVSEWITNSPLTAGATQFVCAGAVVIGCDSTSPQPTNVVLALTNDAALTWQWRTLYALEARTTGPGAVSAGGWCAAGGNASLTATPAANAHFVRWSGDTNGCAVAGSGLVATMDCARAITAEFAYDLCTITVYSACSKAMPGTTHALYGTVVTQRLAAVSITANLSRYLCAGVSVTGDDFAQPDAATVVLTLTNDATLTWNWQKQNLLTTVAEPGGTVTSGGWVNDGITTTVVARATNGAVFSGWSGDLGDCLPEGRTLTVPMAAPRTIHANFRWYPKTLKVFSAFGGANPSSGDFDYGSNIVAWVNNSPVVNGGTRQVCTGADLAGNDGTFRSATNVALVLTNDAVLTWHWQPQVRLSAGTSGNGSVSGAGWLDAGATAALVATPATGAHFVGWTGDTNGCTANDLSLSVPMTGVRAIGARFAMDIKTLVVDSPYGSVYPDTCAIAYGTTVTAAVVDSPVTQGTTQRVCAGGTVVSNDFSALSATNLMLVLTNNACLTWNWQTRYLLTTSTNGNGRMTAGGWMPADSVVMLVATAAPTAHFTGWAGTTSGCTIAGGTIRVPMTGSRVITARFAAGAQPVLAGRVTLTKTTNGVAGVVITFSRGGGAVTTGVSGAFSCVVPYGWSGVATPTNAAGGTFTPTSKSFGKLVANPPALNFVWKPPVTPSAAASLSLVSPATPKIILHTAGAARWTEPEAGQVRQTVCLLTILRDAAGVVDIEPAVPLLLPGDATIVSEDGAPLSGPGALLALDQVAGMVNALALLPDAQVVGTAWLQDDGETIALMWNLTLERSSP